MTQTNNEREAFESKFDVSNLKFIDYYVPIDNLNSAQWTLANLRNNQLTAWLARAQSPISQNEQQEAVAWRYRYWEGGHWNLGTQPTLEVDSKWLHENYPNFTIEPLYTSPPKQVIPEGWVKIKKDAERYRWLRGVSRDPDESSPHCVVTEEVLEKGKAAKMVSYLVFDEKLDAEIDKMLNAAPTNTEVGNDR